MQSPPAQQAHAHAAAANHSVNRIAEADSSQKPARTFRSRSDMATSCTMEVLTAAVTTLVLSRLNRPPPQTIIRQLPHSKAPSRPTSPRHPRSTSSSHSHSRRLTLHNRSERTLINSVETSAARNKISSNLLAAVQHSKTTKPLVRPITAARRTVN